MYYNHGILLLTNQWHQPSIHLQSFFTSFLVKSRKKSENIVSILNIKIYDYFYIKYKKINLKHKNRS